MELLPNSPPIDRENAFLLYATFCGDVVKTAHALNVSPVAVLRVVEDEGWTEKLKGIIELKNSGKPGDLERGINRAICYVQCHRMRLVVERAIRVFTDLSEQEFRDQLTTTGAYKNKEGAPVLVRTSTRSIADLASAMEKCHSMLYAALGDSGQERVRRKEIDGSSVAVCDMHAKIAEAMAKVGASKSPRSLLFDAQIAHGQELTAKVAKDTVEAEDPNNDDDH
jgi:hypothetical protein